MARELTLADAILSANTGLDAIKRAPIVEQCTGIKCLRIQDVNQKKDFLNWGNTLVEEKNFEKFQLKEDDIIIARTGGSVGSNRYINQELQAVFNNGLIRIRVDTQKHNPKFIYYLLQTKQYESHINSIAYSTSAQPNMKIRDFLRLEFKELDLEAENKVEEILSNLDAKIELNRQTNQTLEEMAQALFKSWFVDFDPVIDNALAAGTNISDFPEALQHRTEHRKYAQQRANYKPLPDDIRSLFPNEFEQSDDLTIGIKGWIPKGWIVSNVGKEFDVTMGQSPPGSTYNELNEGIPFFQGKTDYGFRFPSNRIYCTAPKRLAKENDTLVSVRAPVGTINLAAENCAIGRGLAAVRHKSGNISFTYYAMNDLAKHFEVFEGEGTVFGSINQKDFNALPQLSHPSNLVTTFNMFCADLDEKIKLTSLQIHELTKLRDTLLPKLISGELTLPSENNTKTTEPN